MNLSYTAEDLAFREQIRSFFRDHLPVKLAEKERNRGHLRRADYVEWHRTLARKGWIAPSWVLEDGGTGWTPMQRHLWDLEYGRAGAPEVSVIALSLVGPIISSFSNAEQKAKYLPGILSGDIYFCQGFSEPQAGSDLATVRTRAILDGDHYIINGQKIWTSHALEADFMICLCRTDTSVKPQAGLSMIILPMNTNSMIVRHIPSIDGAQSIFEVFLEDVRVPVSELVGEENKAWGYAKFLLNNERTHNAYIGILRRYQDRLKSLPNKSASFKQRLSLLEIDIDALEWSVLRVLIQENSALLDAAASGLKVSASKLLLRAAELEIESAGIDVLQLEEEGLPSVGHPSCDEAGGKLAQMMYWRAASVFGGANEVQRGIIWNSLVR